MKQIKHENYVIVNNEMKKYDDLSCEQKIRLQDTMLEKVIKEAGFEKVTGKNNRKEQGKN